VASDKKWKLDDFLAAGGTAEDMEMGRTDDLTFIGNDPERPDRSYEERDSGLIWWKPSRDGPIPTPITNFCARIVGQVLEEGQVGAAFAAPRRLLEIAVTHQGRPRCFLVPSERFSSLDWVMQHLGSTALVFPLPNSRDHVAAAIQALSRDPPERYVYTRTGWRKMPDGNSVYVHGGGAIGARAVEGISVCLSPALKPFVLPLLSKGKNSMIP